MKLIKVILCFALLLIFVPLSSAPANAATEENTLTFDLGTDEGTASLDSLSIDEFQSFIDQPGNTILITGNDIDKVSLYEKFLKALKLPLFLDDDEFVEANPDIDFDNNNETPTSIDGFENVLVSTKTTSIAIYNANGKIVVLQNDEPINESFNKSDTEINSLSANMGNTLPELLNDFKSDMDAKYSGVAARSVTQGNILTSIRKTLTTNGSYTAIGGATVNYVAGTAVTDYILYANTAGTHFYVLADSQISPAGVASANDAVWTTGYKSNIRTNSSTNSLISWSPNTNSLQLDTNSTYTVGASASATGIALSFSYSWKGAPSTTMQSVGDKVTGLTTEYVYKTNGKALATDKFTIGHGALIQATNRVLSFSASHQFRNEVVYTSGTTWYSTNATNLSYSF